MNEKCYHAPIERLRAPERIALLETGRVADICLRQTDIRRVLDVGTGSGIFAEVFVQRGCTVTGLDINPEMIEAASKLVPEAEFQAGSMETLPFPDHSFDIVFMAHVLHETDMPVQALSEARRVCRVRSAVLEWPYLEETKGPPLNHRLSPEAIHYAAEEAGFSSIFRHSLKHMELWVFQSS